MIFSIALVIYLNSIPNKWAIDDSIVVHGNRYVQRGVSGLDSIFSKGTFYGFYGADINAVAGDRYRPLTLALFAIQAELFAAPQKDEKGNIVHDKAGFVLKDLSDKTNFPAILHGFNVLCYALLCLLLYRLILFLLNPTADEKQEKSFFVAALCALLFTLHPLHTEAVANVKGLDEIMTLLLALSATYLMMKAVHFHQKDSRNYRKNVAFACVAFALAMFAKETGIAFFLVIPMTMWFFTQKSWTDIAKISAPLLLSVVLFLGVRAVALSNSKGIAHFKSNQLMNDPFIVLNDNATFKPLVQGSDLNILANPAGNTFVQMPYSNQLATNIYSFGAYFKLLLLPYPLTYDYYPRHISIQSFSEPLVLLSLALNVFLLIWAFRQTKKRHPLAYGIWFYFATFALVSNLFFPIGTNMAERFMFAPLLGFCFCAAFLFYDLKEKVGEKAIIASVLLLSLTYSGITVVRNFDWKDDFTLMSHDIDISKNSGKVKLDIIGIGIAKAVNDEVAALKAIKSLSVEEKISATKAIRTTRDSLIHSVLPYAKEGLAISPMFGIGWLQVARAYHLLSQTESTHINQRFTYLNIAIAAYKQASFYRPINSEKEMKEYMGLCYMDLGKFYGQNFGDNDKAIALLEEAIKLNKENSEPYFLLGTAYSMKKDYAKSIENTETALGLNAEDYKIKENLAVAYQQFYLENRSQKALLAKVELLLLSALAQVKNLADNDLTKKESLLRTLDLLQKNYALQGNETKRVEYANEIILIKK